MFPRFWAISDFATRQGTVFQLDCISIGNAFRVVCRVRHAKWYELLSRSIKTHQAVGLVENRPLRNGWPAPLPLCSFVRSNPAPVFRYPSGCVGNSVRRESRRSPVGANPTRPIGRSAGSNQSGARR